MDDTDPARQLAASPLGWMPADSFPAGRRSRERRTGFIQRRFDSPAAAGSRAQAERWRLIVEGRVQGVGYRAACCSRAQSLGLGGWVRNLPDGRVELEAEGGNQQLNDLRLWCEIGPPHAEVRRVSTLPVGTTGEHWFEVRR